MQQAINLANFDSFFFKFQEICVAHVLSWCLSSSCVSSSLCISTFDPAKFLRQNCTRNCVDRAGLRFLLLSQFGEGRNFITHPKVHQRIDRFRFLALGHPNSKRHPGEVGGDGHFFGHVLWTARWLPENSWRWTIASAPGEEKKDFVESFQRCRPGFWGWESCPLLQKNNRGSSGKYYPSNERKLLPSRELTYPIKNGILKMTFLFPRWDMLVPWRVIIGDTPPIFPLNPWFWEKFWRWRKLMEQSMNEDVGP